MEEFIKEYFEQDNCGTAYPIYFVIRDLDWQPCYHFEDADRYICIYDTEEIAQGKNLKELFSSIEKEHPDLPFPVSWDKNELDEWGYSESEAEQFAEKYSDCGCYILGQKKCYTENNMFLLKSEASDHLKANYYHYSNEAIVYCKHAWRAPRQDKFFEELKSDKKEGNNG